MGRGSVQGSGGDGLETVRSLVIVEDDAGDTLLVSEMLSDVAPNVTLTCFTTLQSAIDGWPADADCALLDLGLPDAVGRNVSYATRHTYWTSAVDPPTTR